MTAMSPDATQGEHRAQAGEGLACFGNEEHKMPLAHPRMSNPVRLPRSIACCIAALVLSSAAAGRARASCPIALRGDPDIAAKIQAELAQFTDDGSACVALAITCGAGDGGLTIELDDELGGHALRTFDSAGGASAFLISWSRRPGASNFASPGASTLAGPGASSLASAGVVARVAERPSATAPAAWRGELHAGYIMVPRGHSARGAGAALVRHDGALRGGIAGRVLVAGTYYIPEYEKQPLYIGGQLEGMLGVQGHLGFEGYPRLIGVRAEVAVGASMLTPLANTESWAGSSGGPHGAARVTASCRLGYGLQVELGLGFEVMWQRFRHLESPIGEAELQPYPHLDIGLGWAR